MRKKIIIILTIFLCLSCDNIPSSIGKFNDLIVVTSKEDKDYVYPYLEKIINKTINTPIEESIFNVKWIDASNFFDYQNYTL